MVTSENSAKRKKSTRSLICGLPFALTMSAFASQGWAQVTPDGQTATTSTTAADGHITVDIAPIVADRVSYNTYTDFNVSEAGLDFDNRVVGARTIVNEVTGSNPSSIMGDVEVLGQRAHVILANTNGITVNGANFINTGGLSLSTGELSFAQRQVGPGIFQINTVLETGEGVIRIEGAGLSGTMDRLDILAREIKISADLTNENADPRSAIALYAGSSRAEYDSSVVPTNAASRWSFVNAGGPTGLETSQDAVLVDITRAASLTASSVLIEVTDLGAGVRYAGDGLATRRAFTISADGDLVMDAPQITGATDVNVTGASISMVGDIAAERRAELNSAFGAVNLTALEGDIDIQDARLTGFSGFEPLGVEGAVNILAENGGVSIGSSSEATRSDIITFSRDDFEVADDIIIQARDSVTIEDAVLSSAANIDVSGSDVLFGSNLVNAVMFAEGAVRLVAETGNVEILGGTIQGSQAMGDYESALQLSAAQDVINQTSNADYVSILFGQSDVDIQAGGRIINDTARIVSDGEINLSAVDGVEVSIGYADGGDEGSFDVLTQSLREAGRSQSVDFGELPLGGLLSFVTAGTNLNIASGSLTVRGGNLSANDGDINIESRVVDLESVYSGSYDYERSCFIFCRSSGSSSINAQGGRLAASGNVNIADAETLTLLGGEIVALGDINVDADAIRLEGIPIVTIHARPAGLYNFWAGSSAYITWQDRFGVLNAGGTLDIISQDEVELDGGQLLAANIVNPAGVRLLSLPDFDSPIGNHHIGFFAQIGLLHGDDDSDDDIYDEDDDQEEEG